MRQSCMGERSPISYRLSSPVPSVGQPFRIGYLDAALGEMVRRQGVWAATGAEVIEWYRRHPPAA
jgi:hypothetical protein